MSGVDRIAAERQRQIDAEGWTPEHDDKHPDGALAEAAACYALAAWGTSDFPVPEDWPWDAEWWKPSGDTIRTLVIAGALIAAEIDRIERAEALARGEEPS